MPVRRALRSANGGAEHCEHTHEPCSSQCRVHTWRRRRVIGLAGREQALTYWAGGIHAAVAQDRAAAPGLPVRPGEGVALPFGAVRDPVPDGEPGFVFCRDPAVDERPPGGSFGRAVASEGHERDEKIAALSRRHIDGDDLGVTARPLGCCPNVDELGRGGAGSQGEGGVRLQCHHWQQYDECEKDPSRCGNETEDQRISLRGERSVAAGDGRLLCPRSINSISKNCYVKSL